MIIGFTGLIGAGKDTAAGMIRQMDASYETKSFADRLKDMTAALFGWNRAALQGDTPQSRAWREEKDDALSHLFQRTITPRNQLQHLGFSMKAVLHPDVWALFLKDEIMRKNLKNVLITDVRSRGEIEMVRSLGGLIVRVQRGPLPDWFVTAERFNALYPAADALPEPNSEFAPLLNVHPTEWKWAGIDAPDYILCNDSTLEAFRERVQNLFQTIRAV